MKIFINTILFLILGLIMTTFIFLVVDISVAHRDFQRYEDNGDYEKRIEGCIFEYVCNYYNEKLWR